MKSRIIPCLPLLAISLLTHSLYSQTVAKPERLTSPDQTPEGLEKSDWASIRAAHNAWQHSFMEVSGGWQARNKGQQWTTHFDQHGFVSQPQGGEWQWGLELRSYGFGENQRRVGGRPKMKAAGQRLSYQWDGTLQEWWINDTRGLEHGFTFAQRPDGGAGGESLDLQIGIRGTLKASVSADAQTVYFRDEAGAPVVNYSGLKVWDADGKVLASSFAAGNNGGIVLQVEEGDARYPLTIDPIAQQAFVKTNVSLGSANRNDHFGASVAVSGDTVVVGAFYEDSSSKGINSIPNESAVDSGAAYVFVRSGSNWKQQAYLKASNPGADDWFGASVSVSGDTVVVGASGEDSGTTGVNSTPNDSAYGSGAAYVFVRSGSTWTQQAYIKASNTGADDLFGSSVAVSGDTVVVGSPYEDSGTIGVNTSPNENARDSGAAYVFVRSGSTWTQQAYLKASNTGADDQFATSVAVSGETVVVGASGEDSRTTGVNSTPNDSASGSGAAYVFLRSGSAWTQQAYLKASNAGNVDYFGTSVAISANTIVIGAPGEWSSTTGVNKTPNDNSPQAGAAYVFVRSGSTWTQQAYLKASNTGQGDWFGQSVAVSANTVVVGAVDEDSSTTGIDSIPNESASGSGAAYVFVRSGSTWSQQAYLKAGNTGSYDQFGRSVAVDGDTAMVGSFGEDSSTMSVNSPADDGANDSGAAYVFLRSGGAWSQQAYMKPAGPLGVANINDFFGISVGVSGDTVVVGSPGEDSSTTGIDSVPNELATNSGAAYVFVRGGEGWMQQAYLKASVANGGFFGSSVAASGDTVIVGSPFDDSSTTGVDSSPNLNARDSGAVYVFVRNGTTWSQQAYLKSSNTGVDDFFGESVAVTEDTLVVGAPGEDSSTTGINSSPNESAPNSGAAYVFVRTGSTWSQQAYLKASNAGAGDLFGKSVAVSSDTLVVGASAEDSSTAGINAAPNESAADSGAAYVFMRSGSAWTQQAYIKAANVEALDSFGASVAVSGDTLIVGAPESGYRSGVAYVFVRSGGNWSQQASLKGNNTAPFDNFGQKVAVDGDTAIIGAPGEDSGTAGINSIPNAAAPYSGGAYAFVRSGGTWSQQAYLKASNPDAGDRFGSSVAISGDTVVVGAPNEDSSTTGINSTPDEDAADSGALYIFSGLGPVINSPIMAGPIALNIVASSATLGSTVTEDGGATVTERGVVYSKTTLNADPEIGGSGVLKVIAAGTTGAFTVPVSGLSPNTQYSYKAYATNSQGTGYSSVATFVTLPLSPNADLLALRLSSGTLDPSFNTSLQSYAATVYNSVDAVAVTPTQVESHATIQIRINGGVYANVVSGTASPAMPLAVGVNLLEILVTAEDGVSMRTYQVTVTRSETGPLDVTLAAWRAQYFGSADNTGDAADLATPDGDGIANLIKYALLMTPGQHQPELLPQGALRNGRLSLTFRRDPLRTDVSIIVEAQNGLAGAWTEIARSDSGGDFTGPANVSEIEGDAGVRHVTVLDTEANATKRFLRVRVER